MAPFPEAEDMTIKRLYVALKRSDMQLLQMGAHKLHEKFHTGHKFELIDDLKQILSYVEEQNIPNDIKELLTRTISDILNGNPPYENIKEKEENIQEDGFTPFEEENPVDSYNSEFQTQSNYNPSYYEKIEEDEKQEPEQLTLENNFNQDEAIKENKEDNMGPVLFTPQKEEKEETAPIDIIYPNAPDNSLFKNIQHNEPVEETKTETPVYSYEAPVEEKIDNQIEEKFEESSYNNSEEQQESEYQGQNQDIYRPQEGVYQEPEQNETEQTQEKEQNNETETVYEEPKNEIILEEKVSTLENVAVFYDDKATVIDYMQNKLYRSSLDLIALNKEAYPLDEASINKNLVDVPTDEIGEILKMLNTIKGQVYFITTSKSENIIKSFIENYINFEIPMVNENQTGLKTTKLIPLYGLSNLFVCPKCGYKEYFGGIHNKVLFLQCKKCASVMYPDIYEADNYSTNANPYYWVKAVNSMAHADTWILINPPMENNRGLTFELLKSSFEISKPKTVYILSKETTKKEYYKQIFKEIYPDCDIKADFITQDELCESFINGEMSTLKVNI